MTTTFSNYMYFMAINVERKTHNNYRNISI